MKLKLMWKLKGEFICLFAYLFFSIMKETPTLMIPISLRKLYKKAIKLSFIDVVNL